jgi:CCR4-NOT transcription complex subunit 1
MPLFEYDPILIGANRLHTLKQDVLKFPVGAFFGRWNNVKGQFSFLKVAVQSAPELFQLSPSLRRVIDPSAFSAAMKNPVAALVNQPWNSLELIDSVIRISESEVFDEVKSFLEFAAQQSPELLLLGLSQLPVCY